MATVTKQYVTPNTTTITMAAASGGGDVIQDPRGGTLLIRNGGGSSITATLTTPGTLPNGDSYPDKVVTVPNGTDRWITLGPEYVDANNQCAIAWSAVTSVTFCVVQLP